jgi:hypothetical protein
MSRLTFLVSGPLVVLASLFIGLPRAEAQCFPMPVGILCVLDREGGATQGFYCEADSVQRKGTENDGRYDIQGRCNRWASIQDDFGGDMGQVDDVFHFDAKAAYRYDPIHKVGAVQEAADLFKDPQRTQRLGELQGTYSCPKNPMTGLNVLCQRTALSTRGPDGKGLETLPPRLPLSSGLAAPRSGTAQQGLAQAADEPYVGVWRAGDDRYYLWHVSGWAAFVDKWKQLGKARMRLTNLESFATGGHRHFVGVWREGRDPYYLWRASGWKAFTDKWDELARKNLRLVDVETYLEGNDRRYVGVWRGGTDDYALWQGRGWKAFADQWSELAEKGLRLVDIETFGTGDQRHYVGVWRAGRDGHYLWRSTGWKAFTEKWSELAKQGLRLIDVESYVEGNARHYVGVWRSGTDGYALWRAKNWEDFTRKWRELSGQKLRLIAVERE